MLGPAGVDKTKISFLKTSQTTSHPFQGNCMNKAAITIKKNKILKNTLLALWELQSG